MADERAHRFQSFEEFWPFYVKEHQKKSTRVLHFIGTTTAMSCLAAGVVFRKKWLLVVAPIAGYAPAWIGHFVVERNRPATFAHPLWSLRADFVMWSKMVKGEMDAEVERVLAADREAAESSGAGTSEPETPPPSPTTVRSDAVN